MKFTLAIDRFILSIVPMVAMIRMIDLRENVALVIGSTEPVKMLKKHILTMEKLQRVLIEDKQICERFCEKVERRF